MEAGQDGVSLIIFFCSKEEGGGYIDCSSRSIDAARGKEVKIIWLRRCVESRRMIAK